MIVSDSVKLDAVNEIIGSIGEAPVNTLEDSYNVDVVNALRLLEKINRAEQARGWSWNTEENYTLNPDYFSHKIYWQNDFLYVKGSSGENFVKRGDYLYDKDNKTFDFDSSIEVTCIRYVAFEDMPEAMQAYITAKAARQFQARYLGDDSLAQELMRNEQEAWAKLQEYELELNNFNFFDNTDVMTIKDR